MFQGSQPLLAALAVVARALSSPRTSRDAQTEGLQRLKLGKETYKNDKFSISSLLYQLYPMMFPFKLQKMEKHQKQGLSRRNRKWRMGCARNGVVIMKISRKFYKKTWNCTESGCFSVPTLGFQQYPLVIIIMASWESHDKWRFIAEKIFELFEWLKFNCHL